MKTNRMIFAAAIFLSIGIMSCNKDEISKESNLSEPAFETEAGNISDELEKSADAVTFDKTGDYDRLPECATVNVFYPEGPPFPKVITIDYGETNCQVRPNIYKRGKVIITLSDSITAVNAKRLVTFEDFYINDRPVTGTLQLTNLGYDDNGQPVFGMSNHFSVGDWSRQTTGTKTWIQGYGSGDYTDNIFLLDGSSSTTRPNGVIVNRTITEALLVDRECGYITSGILSVNWNGNSAIIDFGDGSCDDQAVITINGEEYIIDLDDYGWRKRRG